MTYTFYCYGCKRAAGKATSRKGYAVPIPRCLCGTKMTFVYKETN